MTPEREQRLLQVLRRRQPDLTLIADKVHKPRNMAALVRNCDAVGIPKMHVVKPDHEYRRYRGTSRGSDRWVESVVHSTLSEAVDAVRDQGMKIYAAHLSDSAVDFHEVDYTVPCAILMGAEKAGISEEAAQAADLHITVPMMGMVESLNVSTAAGIILIEAQRQRKLAGLYELDRMPAEVIARHMFESRYQKIATYCLTAGLPYPEYDEMGELLDPEACKALLAQRA
ncbi:tRNA (guanosine(18)-2'-O)-methyltransferase TrmH [Marinobacterium mangrovicola]|uniref:tRNA (guanosine(18)-2'-O)-methyltransferase n=1 Tax=Marinobacterium mangrovicola TaxID=1476959 RepID=A0A4R1GR99_9GAMM|nr:tRNA (guanosine(18)-2'-O)-methyltransferase TrmH [Marinobacterium mangrovicola]TCK08709.1 tRNA (guanosine-2'-O-)-methyltransferase [Marinobacterium mangrovicola]